MDGQTTWNASIGSPPCAAGSVSSGMIASNSTNDPGQPCVMTSGNAPGSGERGVDEVDARAVDLGT